MGKVAFFGRKDDGTIDEKLEDQKWESRPIIKTFYIGDENLCEGDQNFLWWSKLSMMIKTFYDDQNFLWSKLLMWAMRTLVKTKYL